MEHRSATIYLDEDAKRDEVEASSASPPLPDAPGVVPLRPGSFFSRRTLPSSSAGFQLSVVSAPPKLDAPRCFLSTTRFKLVSENGKVVPVTATELRKRGGQTLEGPGGASVQTLRVIQYERRDTDLVEIDSEGAPHPFKITKDHVLHVVTAAGDAERVQAKELLEPWLQNCRISDGAHRWLVNSASLITEHVAVVEIFFQNPTDALVLAWVLPRPRPHRGPRHLCDSAAVACFGSQPSQPAVLTRTRPCRSEPPFHS